MRLLFWLLSPAPVILAIAITLLVVAGEPKQRPVMWGIGLGILQIWCAWLGAYLYNRWKDRRAVR